MMNQRKVLVWQAEVAFRPHNKTDAQAMPCIMFSASDDWPALPCNNQIPLGSAAVSFVPTMTDWPDPIDQANDVTGDCQPHYSSISKDQRVGVRILDQIQIQIDFWRAALFKILHKF
jgi:hypothetical protein